MHARRSGCLHSPFVSMLASGLQKTRSPAQVTVPLEDREHVVAERDLARFAVLRGRDFVSREVSRDDETAFDEIDAVPLEREKLALAEILADGEVLAGAMRRWEHEARQ